MIHQLCAAAILGAAVATSVAETNCDGHWIYIIEDSGFFNAPGLTPGRIGRFCSSDPSKVDRLALAGGHLGPFDWGGLGFRPGTDELYAFENTTNSLRVLKVESDGNTLIDSVGHVGSGITGMAFSNDGSTVYVAGTSSFWGRIIQADADTGEVLAVNDFANMSAIGSLAVVPEGTDLPYPAGSLLGIRNIGSAPGAQLVHIDLAAEAATVIGSINGIGFNAAFESGLDFAPDGTLYAAIQGFTASEDISTHIYTLDPVTAVATSLGVINEAGTWDVSSIAVRPAPASKPGDLNGDGVVDVSDMLQLLNYWGECPVGPCPADLNNDGVVDVSDMMEVLNNWG